MTPAVGNLGVLTCHHSWLVHHMASRGTSVGFFSRHDWNDMIWLRLKSTFLNAVLKIDLAIEQ